MPEKTTFERFVSASPFAVMTRMLSHVFIDACFDDLFEEYGGAQYESKAKFPAVAVAVADVVVQFSDNFNQSYANHRKKLEVAVQSFYGKINGIAPQLSQSVVAESAFHARVFQDLLDFEPWEVIPGYRCFCIDGNVLAKSDKRLGALRESKGAPLPGKVVARFDLQHQIFDRAYPLVDGHAQESTTCGLILEDLQENDVIIADRHYCIVDFLTGIDAKDGYFAIRQHGRLKGKLLGKRKKIGRIETGVVYEQEMKLSKNDDAMSVRRVTVVLDKPTRDGDTEIHILTNLPALVDAKVVANAYRFRWEEETAFHVLQMTLTCELATVGHPKAALFLFACRC